VTKTELKNDILVNIVSNELYKSSTQVVIQLISYYVFNVHVLLYLHIYLPSDKHLTLYRSVLSDVSRNRGRSWNLLPVDTGALHNIPEVRIQYKHNSTHDVNDEVNA
jgi:hypothetical protein